MRLSEVSASEILDSRGQPTLEVTMSAASHTATFSVPGGKSTGKREAKPLHGADGSIRPAIAKLKALAPKLIGHPLAHQADFDSLLLSHDATADKHELGANTMLALSGAYLRLSAAAQNQPLWHYISQWSGSKPAYPRLYANLVNGGKHAPGLDVQEFMVVPKPAGPLRAIGQIRQTYAQLGEALAREFGPVSQLVGDEGGFAPSGATHQQIWQILFQLSQSNQLDLACDVAASSFARGGHYHLEGHDFTRQELAAVYLDWGERYQLLSIEDPFGEDDVEGFQFLAQQRPKFFVVGDDLTTTNAADIERYAGAGLIGGVIIKPNQIGTFTETLAAIKAAQGHNCKVIISHRSGETLDTTIADLAVGVGAFGLKLGAPARGERIAKYNRLLNIEEEMI